MEFFDVLRGRQSVRDFRPDPVSPGVIHQLADAAVLAPSAMNEQPWRFIAITDRRALSDISARAKSFIREDVEMLPNPEHFRSVFDEPEIDLFHGAPALIVIAGSSSGPWIAENCALAGGNLMLAAHALGLGTCWIGFVQGWMNSRDGRDFLDLKPEEYVIAPIAIGYAKSPPAARGRRATTLRWLNPPTKPH